MNSEMVIFQASEMVIFQAAVEGVRLSLSPPDNINVIGDEVAVNRWLPVIRQHKPAIIAALLASFEFVQPDTDEDAHRQSCWQAFQHNVKRILGAPRANWDAMLNQYQAEAAARYGEHVGAGMAAELRSWTAARGLH